MWRATIRSAMKNRQNPQSRRATWQLGEARMAFACGKNGPTVGEQSSDAITLITVDVGLITERRVCSPTIADSATQPALIRRPSSATTRRMNDSANTSFSGRKRALQPRRGDLLAGISIAAIAIPQALAYAELAGMPAHTGLYAAACLQLLRRSLHRPVIYKPGLSQ